MTDNTKIQLSVFTLVAIVAVSASSQGRLAMLPQDCTPGEVTADYCNSCTCQDDGRGFLCTTYECPEPTTKEGWNYKVKPVTKRDESGHCVAGQTKRVACYTCTCAGNPPNWFCPAVGCI